jgi:hypothetical protein
MYLCVLTSTTTNLERISWTTRDAEDHGKQNQAVECTGGDE